ncbi:NAD(P)H-hydrate dehydratase [Litorivicinus sp.]|nr:NAD(P)H-hydrate dehydratase [Litorivicinus sp.]
MDETFDAQGARVLDRQIIASGVSGFCLMIRAAKAACDRLLHEHPQSVICLAGPGNNGGDAYGVAGLLVLAGIPTQLVALTTPTGDALKARHFFEDVGGEVLDTVTALNAADWVVDGLLGTGCDRPPEGAIASAIHWIHTQRAEGALVMSLDVPSGLNASTGQAYHPSIEADMTLTFLALKTGLLTGEGPSMSGEVCFDALKPWSVEILAPHTRLISEERIDLPSHSKTAHKGSRGSVLVVGGRQGMEGAGQLCGLAALRTGAGKVFWATDAPLFDVPELIRVPWDVDAITSCATDCLAVVIGPGLGLDAGPVIEALWELDVPLVVDADALNWLSEHPLPNRKAPWIATPHPLEAHRLTGQSFDDRFSMLESLETLYAATWVLKGAGTLVTGKPTWLNPLANPGLGTAGSGDILAGMIGSLWAQGSKSPAITGVWLHSQAFLAALNHRGSGVIASDVIEMIGRSKTA